MTDRPGRWRQSAKSPSSKKVAQGWRASSRRHLFADHQGSIAGITDSSGSPIGIDSYDEWGVPGASNQGKFQYTGQLWIAGLGTYFAAVLSHVHQFQS